MIKRKSERKRLIIMVILFLVVLLACMTMKVWIWRESHPPVSMTVDLTKDLVMEFKGADGNGTAEIIKNPVTVTGPDEWDELDRWLENLDYEIQPDAALSNGDTVTVRVQYDEQLAAHLGIEVQNSEKRLTVEHLVNDKSIQTGKNSQDMEVEIIDGIEVPVAWGLDEEAKLEYVQGQKKAQQIVVPDAEETQDDPAKTIEWLKGTGTEKVPEMVFSNYGSALEHGLSGSEEFRIETQTTDGSLRYKVVTRN